MSEQKHIDTAYFKDKLEILLRDIHRYENSSADLARVLTRLAVTSDEQAVKDEMKIGWWPIEITLGNIRHLSDELDNAKEDPESLHRVGKELVEVLTSMFLKYKSIPTDYHNEILYNLTNGSFDDYVDMTTKLHGNGIDIYGRV